MKIFVLAFVAILNLTFNLSQSNDKVIYGDDNRVHSFDSQSALYQSLARSTLAMIPKRSLEFKFQGLMATISGSSLDEDMRLCKDERFTGIVTAANCSAFLVGEDTVVTAGHCVRDLEECQSSYWVFDFRSDLALDSSTMNLASDVVYECSEIISKDLSRSTMNDYALIRLDRKVLDRAPLKVRTEGKIAENTPLVVIGHPSGLPTVISEGAWVREGQNEHPYYFRSNLDTFGGNSGSAVFNTESGLVEGILVRGENDYDYDSESDCNRPFKCENDNCRGEDVTRITVIPELAPGMTPTEEDMVGFLVEDDEDEQGDEWDFDFDFEFDPEFGEDFTPDFGDDLTDGLNDLSVKVLV